MRSFCKTLAELYQTYFPSTDQLINQKLEAWKVDMFAQNTYLMTIPQRRIDEKRAEIEQSLSK